MSASNRAKDIRIAWRGVEYRWTPQAGFTTTGGMAAPMALRPVLEAQLEPLLAAEDDAIKDLAVLTERAAQARRLRQLARAERLAKRVLSAKPRHLEASAVLAATLVDHKEPEAALEVAEPYARSEHAPLHAARAGALADLGRWEEALRAAQIALVLFKREGSDHAELLRLLERIETRRAD